MENNIADKINLLIESLGISKNEFAKQIGISSSLISQITTKKNNFRTDVLQKITSKYPYLNAEWLLNGIGEMWSENHTYKPHLNTGYTNQRAKIVDRAIDISKGINSNDTPIFEGYYEDNRIAFYLRHSESRLDGMLSSRISEMKDIYNANKKLTNFMISVGAPDFIVEKYPPMDSFEVYKNEFDEDFNETYEMIKDAKVLKATMLLSVEMDIEGLTSSLIGMINYADRYDDFFEGHSSYKS